MVGMLFPLQQDQQGPLQVLGAAATAAGLAEEEERSFLWGGGKRRKGNLEEALLLLEPRSVLEHRRSPSPPTSTSTVSSSLGGSASGSGGGGAASSDTAGLAAVSDKWPLSSSSATTTPSAAAAEAARKEEWAAELPPIPASLAGGSGGGGLEDWEAMLSEPAVSPAQDQTFLRWIMGDVEDPSCGSLKHHQILSHNTVEVDLGCGSNGLQFSGLVDPAFALEGSSASLNPAPLHSSVPSACEFGPKDPIFGRGSGNNPILAEPAEHSLPLLLSLPPGALFQDPMEEKSFLLGPSLLLNQHQQAQLQPNPSFSITSPQFTAAHQECQVTPANFLSPQLKRQAVQAIDPFLNSALGPDALLRRNQPQINAAPFHLQPKQMRPKLSTVDVTAAAAAPAAQQQQALVDQLFKAAELVEAGNFVSAIVILSRLNHQLSSPVGKPLLRSAFYFKEALQLLANNGPHPLPPPSTPLATPLDVVFKLGTYKTFSEVSPIVQFTNFTCIQALLEELGSAERIHIVDFDIGVGGQWSSFMQELAQRRCSGTTAAPLLKITALASPCSHHPMELHLTHNNLCHFAADLNIPFEFNILCLDPFNPSSLLSMLTGNDEAVAVNLPLGSAIYPPISTLLRFVKQLVPKIVVSVDHGCDRSDLPFAHHFFHAFQSCTVLLDSIDAAGTNQEAISKIERFLVQPRVENSVLGRHRAAEKILPWRTLFASVGFVPVQFSNFTETQAECLLKRVQVRGFQVEKRQASLSLCWQRSELVSVSAWRC